MTAKSCCARVLDARDGEGYFLHFFHVSHLTVCDQSWMRARPPASMNLLQRDQMDKIEPEH